MSKETFAGEPLAPHAAADEIARLRAELAAANARIGWFEEHMRMIARIENKLTGGDWDEIEEARWIAWRALDRDAFLKGSRND